MAEEDVRQLTDEAVRKGATEFELAGNGLTGPSPQIGQLSQLQIRLIYDNQSRPTHDRRGCPPPASEWPNSSRQSLTSPALRVFKTLSQAQPESFVTDLDLVRDF